MANRTVQLLGQGYDTSPADITVTANGNIIFSGTISTVNQPLPSLPNLELSNSTVVLCSFDIDQSFVGQIPMSCQINSGTVIFAQIYANYTGIVNPIYTAEQFTVVSSTTAPVADKVAVFTQVANPALSQADIDTLLDPTVSLVQYNAILAAHNLTLVVSSGAAGYYNIDNTDARSNVSIDGVAQTPDHGDLPGTWWWTISSGSTLAYNLDVAPAVV
jgi:hypothetical protein